MNQLMDNPAFSTFALCVAILVLKSFLSSAYTAITRIRSGRFPNPEDAKVFGQQASDGGEAPSVQKALSVQRNDGENLPYFFAIGLVFVLAGASPGAATAYFWTFTVARIVHTLCFVLGLQPFRGLAYGVAALCLIGMSVQVAMTVL